ncbi:integrase [Gossypium australe]|uniref:Integrase n=1 Tax=Gossypium australe TaxID=47621 RepID=A0A5B6WTI7_9ROSI|nr:integrase [Gossypium australe]
MKGMTTSLTLFDDGSILTDLKAKPIFLQQIFEAQNCDTELQAKKCNIGVDDCLMFRNRICVPKNFELIQKILHEGHSGCLSVHQRSTKM